MAPWRSFGVLPLAAVLACLALPLSAQEPSPTQADSAAREKALLRVAGIAARIEDMRDDAAKLRGLGLLGEYTCKTEPALARTYFEKAVEIGRPLQREAAEEAAATPVTRNLGVPSRSVRSRTWEQLLAQVARCDPDLAFQLNQQSEKEDATRADPFTDLRVAGSLIGQDPQKASEFMDRAIVGTATEDLLRDFPMLLWQLRRKDSARADALFLKALQSLAGELRADGTRLLLLGNYLFGAPDATGTAPADSMGFTVVGNVGVPSIMGPRQDISTALARTYLETCLNILSRPSTDQRQKRVDYAAAYQMRHVSRLFAPNLVQLFEGLMTQLAPQVPPSVPEQAAQRLERPFLGMSAQTMEEYEKETDPARRRQMRMNLFRQMIGRSEFENARRLARDTDDAAESEALLAAIDFQEALRKIDRGDVAGAQELLERQKDPAQRVLLQAALAAPFREHGEPGTATQMLFSAHRDAMQIEPRVRGVLLVAITGALAGTDPPSALPVLEQAVLAFNESGDTGGESIQVITRTAGPGANRAPLATYITASARGLGQSVQVSGGQSSFALRVKGLEDFDFTPHLMKKLPAEDERVESVVAALKDEWRRAGALAALAAALLDRDAKPPNASLP